MHVYQPSQDLFVSGTPRDPGFTRDEKKRDPGLMVNPTFLVFRLG